MSSVSKVAFKVGLDGAELGLKRCCLAYSCCLKFLLEREEQGRQVLEWFVFHGGCSEDSKRVRMIGCEARVL